MAETINMPKLGFDMAEGTLVRWVKKVGETVEKGDVLAEIETDKATVEVESTASGVVRKLLADEGAVVPVNSPIAVVGTADEKLEDIAVQASQTSKIESLAATVPEHVPAADASAISAHLAGLLKVSPLAKKIARERSVDLSHLQGSGPGGRIVRRDVESALISAPTFDIRPSTCNL